jgi:hypothetical protein
MALRGEYSIISAAGTTQATATEMPSYNVMVTSATSAQGVILPPMNKGEEAIVCNGSDAEIFVYPRSGGKINNSAADVHLWLSANSAAHFLAIDGLNVIAIF